MNDRSTRLLSITASSLALGLVAWSGLASAAPTADASANVEPAPVVEPSVEFMGPPPLEDEASAVPATNFQCIAQCWRDFTDCLDHGNCSEEYCLEQKNICMSYC